MRPLFLILVIFLATELLGLYAGYQYIQLIDSGQISPAFEDPNSVGTSIFLFGYILITTIGILALIKFRKSAIRILEAFVVFTSAWLTFDLVFPVDVWYLSLGFFLALGLVIWKMKRPSILNQDIAAVISGAGVGSVLGASLGILPAIVFMLILSVYDFVSVFITKHMVHMAKALTERPTSFTVAAPPSFRNMRYSKSRSAKKVHVFQLGVGDMVIPLMFGVSVLGRYTLINSAMSIAGAAVALFLLIYFMSKKPRPMPALPFITFGSLAGFLISLLL